MKKKEEQGPVAAPEVSDSEPTQHRQLNDSGEMAIIEMRGHASTVYHSLLNARDSAATGEDAAVIERSAVGVQEDLDLDISYEIVLRPEHEVATRVRFPQGNPHWAEIFHLVEVIIRATQAGLRALPKMRSCSPMAAAKLDEIVTGVIKATNCITNRPEIQPPKEFMDCYPYVPNRLLDEKWFK